HFPLPQEIVKAGETSIVALWKREGVKRAVGPKRADLLYRNARKSIGLTEGAIAAKHELAMYLEQYTMLCRQIEKLMELIAELVKQIPGAAEMMTIPCVKLVTVAGFLAEVGDLAKYEHSQQIVRHAGLSLRENSSGMHKGETTISKRGRCRLRAILF